MEHRQGTCKCKRTCTKRFVGNRKKHPKTWSLQITQLVFIKPFDIGRLPTFLTWFYFLLTHVKHLHFNGPACSKCHSSCPNFSIFAYRQCNNHGKGNLLIVYFGTCSGQRIWGHSGSLEFIFFDPLMPYYYRIHLRLHNL